jgi:hypothetical protein
MCNKQSILALESAARYIAQCEHKTVHVVWDLLALRFRPADFAQFAGIVEDAYTRMLDRSDPGRFRLLIKGIGLSFSSTDLVVLRELTCLAAIELGHVDATDGSVQEKTAPSVSFSFPFELPSFSRN